MIPFAPPFPAGALPGYELAMAAATGSSPDWREAPWRNLNDWIHLADGVNDGPVFTAALAETDYLMVAPKQGGGDWTMPLLPTSNDGGGTVIIPSNKTIKGLNKHAKIHVTGGNTTDQNRTMFHVWGPVRDITFEDLYVYGDNGTSPATFTYILNRQSNVVFQRTNSFGQKPENVMVRNCTFEYLWGFPVHNGGGKRCHVIGCTARYCANGFNMQSDFGIQAFNDILHSEGFETTGVGAVTFGNVVREGLGGCLVNGGTAILQPGQIVAANYLYPDQTVGGEAMSIGDGFVDGVIVGNAIVSPTGSYYGLAFRNAFGSEYQPKRLVVANNIIRQDVSSAPAIYATSPDTSYVGNIVSGNANVALLIKANNNTFIGNHLPVGTNVTRAIQTDGTPQNIFIDASNQYDPFAWFDGSAGAASFRDGSYLRLTSRPSAAAMWRGVTVAVRGGIGVADTLDTCTKDVTNTYGWRSLI